MTALVSPCTRAVFGSITSRCSPLFSNAKLRFRCTFCRLTTSVQIIIGVLMFSDSIMKRKSIFSICVCSIKKRLVILFATFLFAFFALQVLQSSISLIPKPVNYSHISRTYMYLLYLSDIFLKKFFCHTPVILETSFHTYRYMCMYNHVHII